MRWTVDLSVDFERSLPLMSYGPSLIDAWRQVGLKTANAIGLNVPSAVLALADEVIE
jgi:hypothetical protein